MSSLSVMLDKTPARAVTLVARVAVGVVFLVAAVEKIRDPSSFVVSIANYHMVPDSVASVMAGALPLLEIVVALGLVTGVHARGAALVTGAMLVAFMVAMVQAILRDINIDCGCFGQAAAAQVSWRHVAEDAAMLAACALVALSPDVPFTIRPRSERPRPG